VSGWLSFFSGLRRRAAGAERQRSIFDSEQKHRRDREITRTDLDPMENKYQFVRYLERSEGRPIFRGRG